MKRFISILCFFLLALTLLTAQETADTPADGEESQQTIESQNEIVYTANQKGDSLININLMVNLPIAPKKLNVGGSGQLGYSYFLTDAFNIGGSIAFGFSITEGSNMFLFVPILFRATYQFQVKKFEFPLSLNIGGCFENYLERTYFGLDIKPEVGAYFRYSPEWSFGIFSGLHVLPQWYKESKYDYVGLICDIGASVRYHF